MRVFDWILETTWQGSIAALLILTVQVVLGKRIPPKWRHGLWFVLLARLVLPSLPESPASIFNLAQIKPERIHVIPSGATAPRTPAQEGRSEDMAHRVAASGTGQAIKPLEKPQAARGVEISWKVIAFWCWASGATLLLLRLLVIHVRFHRIIRSIPPTKDERALALLEACKARLAVTQSVLLLESDLVETPCLYGIRSKRLLLPIGFLDEFSETELQDVFLHELAHVRRQDVETAWMMGFLQTLHWFNPVLWFAFARMRHDREIAADALALGCEKMRSNEAYGETILKVLEGFNAKPGMPQLVGVVEGKSWIKERLRAVARHGKVRVHPVLSIALGVLLACITLTGAVRAKLASPPLTFKGRTFNTSAQTTKLMTDSREFLMEVHDGEWSIRTSLQINSLDVSQNFDGERALMVALLTDPVLAAKGHNQGIAYATIGPMPSPVVGDYAFMPWLALASDHYYKTNGGWAAPCWELTDEIKSKSFKTKVEVTFHEAYPHLPTRITYLWNASWYDAHAQRSSPEAPQWVGPSYPWVEYRAEQFTNAGGYSFPTKATLKGYEPSAEASGEQRLEAYSYLTYVEPIVLKSPVAVPSVITGLVSVTDSRLAQTAGRGTDRRYWLTNSSLPKISEVPGSSAPVPPEPRMRSRLEPSGLRVVRAAKSVEEAHDLLSKGRLVDAESRLIGILLENPDLPGLRSYPELMEASLRAALKTSAFSSHIIERDSADQRREILRARLKTIILDEFHVKEEASLKDVLQALAPAIKNADPLKVGVNLIVAEDHEADVLAADAPNGKPLALKDCRVKLAEPFRHVPVIEVLGKIAESVQGEKLEFSVEDYAVVFRAIKKAR